MKKIFIVLGLVIGLSAFAQPKYVGRFFGDGAGLTNMPITGLKNYGNIVTNQVPLTAGLPVVGDGGSGVLPTNNLTVATATAQQFLISGVSNKVAVFQSNGVMVGTNTVHISGQFIADTGFIGDGSGLSNTIPTGLFTNNIGGNGPLVVTNFGLATIIRSNSVTTVASTNSGNIQTATLNATGAISANAGLNVVGTASFAFNSTILMNGPWRITGTVSDTFTGNTNDFPLNGTANVARMTNSTAGNIDMTGISTHKSLGEMLLLINISATPTITLKNESSSSTAANRFALVSDRVLAANESVMIWYDITTARWRIIGKQ